MKKIYLFSLIAFIFTFSILKAQAAESFTKMIKFKIEKKEDMNYKGVIRLQFRIKLYEKASEEKIKALCDKIIKEQKAKNSINAISFLFYSADTGTDGPYTAGKAIWAPYGKWENADMVKAGDYSKHKLDIHLGSVIEKYEAKTKVNISIAKKKKIFHDLVVYQDRGVGDFEAYKRVAQDYKLDIEDVRKIMIEGVSKNWPMP